MDRCSDSAGPQGGALPAGPGSAATSPGPNHSDETPRLSLRVLATSDVHMHLLPHDYLTGTPSRRLGLARTASLIARRRAEASACLLLDNGDFLQGSPMGDVAARAPRAEIHPAIAAMNVLGYDAAALGNHDFNYGLAGLRNALSRARFPVLAANLRMRNGPARWTMLRRAIADQHGALHQVTIGVIGFLPPQTVDWDQDLTGAIACDDIIETARAALPAMRAEGAQIVIALAHSGIGPLEPSPRMEHAATALAALPGIDVVIAGHTHEVFPGPHVRPGPGIDPQRGTLAGKPAVMPGFGGSHLGLIDLELTPFGQGPDRGLCVTGFRVRCESVDPALPSLPEMQQPLLRAHRATRRHLGGRIGRSAVTLSSQFTLLGQDAGLRLICQAQRWHVRKALDGTPWQSLPILSAAAPFRAGGRAGPDHFTHIPPGALSLRHVSALYAFPNRIAAILLTGADVAEWLERSASLFARVPAGARDIALLDPDFPAYQFDMIDGLRWQIDLSRPARYRVDGSLADPQSRRITALTFRGRPIRPEAPFVLATNTYRLASCGLFSPLVHDRPVLMKSGLLTRDVLRAYIRRRRHVSPSETPAWHFVAQPGSSALLPTSPLAEPEAVLSHPAQCAGLTPDGFRLIRILL
ncbi:bifunctional 2',3'-cyclic-nucleotide 2'-phosphodiesterase/3'-nucleotidase [Paracoccus sp. (in: a-proteobacteria)]|uniref:bifunctional 2',3'-cyclic-nucleotide 2'-phosphodiesterase/3'-nucleotidase n=1 Tax=Paracoccus sp. TaxID=267 RepID=UPI00272CE599|nr:bifunctional 2',3'-cyclic-nucleotide 2'-phosphodiesterase/3'-nucleotidase [Paracoccus sp. (in: a-proteobacteria)]